MTTLDNGGLLCGYHHRHLHQGIWHVHTAKDGHPEFIPPDWIGKNRTPIRNHRIRN